MAQQTRKTHTDGGSLWMGIWSCGGTLLMGNGNLKCSTLSFGFDGRYSNITTSREFAWVYNIHKHLFDANMWRKKVSRSKAE